ncbi:hypothetical protein C2845_PM08G25420 [Panicum miliaceum]|uniref:Uncharacterized protein n=1 Tax=Panicum miliaceum TaxID=4540 RepID=A0A3L6R1C9_PANMI|nr:hypothetical protein C2845_PM08G25420 [Panicum miliaceum]
MVSVGTFFLGGSRQYSSELLRNPVMRSTALRTARRSRPLSVRPCPTHTDEATPRLSGHRRAARTCGGTIPASAPDEALLTIMPSSSS